MVCIWDEGGSSAYLFQRQTGGFVGSEAGSGFEVEGAVAAFVVSRDLSCYCFHCFHCFQVLFPGYLFAATIVQFFE
jgi:hypothetical protein